MQGPIWALFLFVFLLATNRYYSVETDAEFISKSAGDVWSYAAIADAVPSLPTSKFPYHHAQRFALPSLAGLIGNWVGIPNEWVMRGLILLILFAGILLTERFAARLGFEPGMRMVLTALIFLNPYSARIGLSLPYMGNDLGFVLGLILLLSGLYMGSAGRMVVGSIIAILCRQTAILFIFPLGLFFFVANWRHLFSKERLVTAVCIVIVTAGYFLTGKVAASMSERSQNLDTLTGLFVWLANDFDLRLLALEFGARGFAVFAIPATILFLLARYLRRGDGQEHPVRNKGDTLCAVVFLLTAGLIALQPILGGPGFGNFPRLGVLGLWALVFGVALLIRGDTEGAEKVRIPKGVLTVLFVVLALHSLHHLFTWPGRFLLHGDPRWFFIVQSLLCAGLLAVLAIRSRFSQFKIP